MNTPSPRESTREFLDAQHSASIWLYRGNRAREKGQNDLAERHYARSQKWLDKMNRLLGNGDGSF